VDKTESGVNDVPASCRHGHPGQASPEGLRCSLQHWGYHSSPDTFTGCNTGNCNMKFLCYLCLQGNEQYGRYNCIQSYTAACMFCGWGSGLQ